MKSERNNKYKLYAWLSIACPIIAFIWGFLYHLAYHSSHYYSLHPESNRDEAISYALMRMQDKFGHFIYYVGIASIIGFVLGVISVKLKKDSYLGWSVIIINVIPSLTFIVIFSIVVLIDLAS
jgi:hypothetical protein